MADAHHSTHKAEDTQLREAEAGVGGRVVECCEGTHGTSTSSRGHERGKGCAGGGEGRGVGGDTAGASGHLFVPTLAFSVLGGGGG